MLPESYFLIAYLNIYKVFGFYILDSNMRYV